MDRDRWKIGEAPCGRHQPLIDRWPQFANELPQDFVVRHQLAIANVKNSTAP